MVRTGERKVYGWFFSLMGSGVDRATVKVTMRMSANQNRICKEQKESAVQVVTDMILKETQEWSGVIFEKKDKPCRANMRVLLAPCDGGFRGRLWLCRERVALG